MRKLNFPSTGIAALLLFTTSLSAGDIGVSGIGARATALGTSYRAISDDWSGMYWNPAGITRIEGWHIGVAAELMSPAGTYKPALLNDTLLNDALMNAATWRDSTFSITRQTETRSEKQIFFVPSLGVVRKLSDKFTVGLGLWVPLGMGGKWDLLDTTGYNSAFPEIDFEIDLKTVDIHPTIAYKLNDRISVGAGAGLVYADVMIRQPLFFLNPYFGGKIRGMTIYEIADATLKDSLEAAGGLTSKYSHLVAESDFTLSGFTYSTNLGVMAKINDQLQIGLSGHYYGDVTLKGKLNAILYYPPANARAQQQIDNVWNDTISAFSSRAILEGANNTGDIKDYEKNAIINAYRGGASYIYTDADAELTLPLPADVGIGISYKVINENNRHLILCSDFQYTFASVWNVLYIDINNGEDGFEFVQNWNNSFRISLGTEFKINPLWTLRGAYYFEKNAGVTETLLPIFPDINPRNSVNLGFQFTINPNIALHCSYEGIFFSEKKMSQYDWVYNDENRFYDNMAGTYNFHVNNFMFGLDADF
ncbi:MAG: outer membrane protein transport protein [Chitinispirillaceae bacterium]|nr:outer membrane protein transport protein [Chitinispirillaceae bacterium]